MSLTVFELYELSKLSKAAMDWISQVQLFSSAITSPVYN